jgi:uncharacterized protein YjbI with pentapeptide repeats
MANVKHLEILKDSVREWNSWRIKNPKIKPNLANGNFESMHLERVNLSGANLRSANFHQAFLRNSNLTGIDASNSNFTDAHLWFANMENAKLVNAKFQQAFCRGVKFSGADLTSATFFGAYLKLARFSDMKLVEADFRYANLQQADLSNSSLISARLSFANLNNANLDKADLTNASLDGTQLVGTKVNKTIFQGANIYGISAWDLKGVPANQKDLQISDEFRVTVDKLEVAQFIYLMLNNEKIRDVIDTIGKKGVLILGRFTDNRINLLNAIREKLRELSFVPYVFDFEKPETKNFTETVRILASLSYFVIVDLTAPRSSPLEVQATIPEFMIPFVPIIQKGEKPFAMFNDLINSAKGVLTPLKYKNENDLMKVFTKAIVERAVNKANQLSKEKVKKIRSISTDDFE